MHRHQRKMIAPIVITVILLLYLLGFLLICILEPMPFLVKLMGLLTPLGLGGVAIFCLIERAEEVGNGEEDDLSNY